MRLTQHRLLRCLLLAMFLQVAGLHESQVLTPEHCHQPVEGIHCREIDEFVAGPLITALNTKSMVPSCGHE